MKRLFASYPRLDGQYGRVSGIKFILGGSLLLVMLYFGGGASQTLGNIRAHNSLLEQRTYEVPWSLMQLQLELVRFLDAVRLRHADVISQDEFMLRYDILWSRTPLLLSSEFKNAQGVRQELWLLVRQIDARIHQLESMVEALAPGSRDYLVILTELSPYLEPLSRTVSGVMHDNVRFYAEYDQAYRQFGKLLYQQIMGFFIALLLLLLLLFRELRRYWSLQQQDPLTGLPNRFALQRYMASMIEQAQPFSVTVLELKDLSHHYQRFGFNVADKLLKICCQRLQDGLLAHEYLAQPNQGQLMVLGKGVVELADVRAQISRLSQALREKISIDGYDFYMESLMGVVLYPFDADNLVELQARGELALELCKQQQQPYVFFDPSLLKEMSRRQQLAKDLPAAIRSNSLTLELRPLLGLPAQHCVGLQVLSRWHHPEFGMIAPSELQRVTELYQCSESLMLWTLQSACSQLSVWQRQSSQPLFISLMLPRALFRTGIEVTLATILQDFSLRPGSLVLEINEQIIAADMTAAHLILQRLRDLGIRVMLTDFGSGKAPIGPLSQLPLAWLKLDSTFCTGIEHQGEPRRQLTTLLAIAEVLGHPLVCCGVDHDSELAVLKKLASEGSILGGAALNKLDLELELEQDLAMLDKLENPDITLLIQGDVVGEALPVTDVGPWLQKQARSAVVPVPN